MSDFFVNKINKAAKIHKCNLCEEDIPVGERHFRQIGRCDGEFFDTCLHEHCNKILAKFCNDNDINGYSPDWVIEWLREEYCDYCTKRYNCEINVFRCDCIVKNFTHEKATENTEA